MQYEKIYLSDDQAAPYLEFYSENKNERKAAVLIFPGGGYRARADHEGEPIAIEFLKAGFNAFVCHYRVSPHRYPLPFHDAISAIQFIKSSSEKFSIFANKIAVCGFSAGAHLAASLGFFNGDENAGIAHKTCLASRPNAMILCYPVISFNAFCHEGSVIHLLGDNPTPKQREIFSWQNAVQKSSPPCFLWHTANDKGVPVQNSLMLADALSKNSVPFELHIFPEGSHGLGLAKDNLRISQWFNLAVTWLNTTLYKNN